MTKNPLNIKTISPGQIVFFIADLEGKHPLVISEIDECVDDEKPEVSVSYQNKLGQIKNDSLPLSVLRAANGL